MGGESGARPPGSEACFCLRINVDTARDARALPKLAELLSELGVRASVFVATGRDGPPGGAAGLLRRALRGMYWRRYGLDTLRSVLPLFPGVEEALPRRVCHDLLRKGFEIGLHGCRHRDWVASAARWSYEEVTNNVRVGLASFERAFGFRPAGFAAPGFVVSRNVLRALEDLGFVYASNTRAEGGKPHLVGASLVEVPVSSRNLEELILQGIGRGEAQRLIARGMGVALRSTGYFCYYTHPSFEVHVGGGFLRTLLCLAESEVGARFSTMGRPRSGASGGGDRWKP